MKKIKTVFFMTILVFIFTGCELLDSLAKETEIIKQIKDEDLKGYTTVSVERQAMQTMHRIRCRRRHPIRSKNAPSFLRVS